MATSLDPLKDLGEKFFLCPVCLNHFNQPKLLPCLHRLCSVCLQTVIQASNNDNITCPMCQQNHKIPENGVDGFKTDFHMRSVIEFIQMRTSFRNKDFKRCVSCCQEENISGYCFKCRDFLCDQCYIVHLNSKMFKDHKSRALNLDDFDTKSLTLDTFEAWAEDPKCHEHVKREAHLCCTTCFSLPVCVACSYSKHKGHELHDISELADNEKRLLELKLIEVNEYKSRVYELQKKVETTKRQLKINDADVTEQLINQYKHQAAEINDRLEKRRDIREEGVKDIEKRRQNDDRQIYLTFEEESIELKRKYDTLREMTKKKYDKEYRSFTETCDKVDEELSNKLIMLDSSFKSLTEEKDALKECNKHELKEVLQYCEQIIERYENFSATASSILSSNDDWTQVQCIPDIRAASETLIAEMKKEFPKLSSLSEIEINDITPYIDENEKLKITIQEESLVDVEGIKDKGWWITGMTSSNDGNVVLTGMISSDYSHITIINNKGEIQLQDLIKRHKRKQRRVFLYRYCSRLSEFEVATVCMTDEIGIYDVRDSTYKKKFIGDLISGWPEDRCVWCVAANPVTSQIIVGTNSRYVYVFDDQLNHSHTIALPAGICVADDVTVHGDDILVCNYSGKRAYAVRMEQSESKLVYQFTKPNLEGNQWGPINVCSDTLGYIYMLWTNGIIGGERFLVQYAQDGRNVITTKKIDGDYVCVTAMDSSNAINILTVTLRTGKILAFTCDRVRCT